MSVTARPAGRETLAEIAEELKHEGRAPFDTLPYGDQIPNAPGAVAPGAVAPGIVTPSPARAPEVYELQTFVVRGPDPQALASEAARRQFVGERLLHRLTERSLESVSRIDVTPWTERDTLILRVWTRVPAAPRS